MAEVKNVREEMIDANYPLWMEQEARKRGGRDGGLAEKVDGGDGESGGDDGDGVVIPTDETEEGEQG